MSQLKLTYFDVDGGRGEPIRLALHIGGIEFEDDRFPLSDFAEVRQSLPLKQVPVLELDGKAITQCNAICRFVGKQTGLYPNDLYLALLCDEIIEALEDVTNHLVRTFGLQGDDLKAKREALVEGPFTRYLRWAESRLKENGGDFFVGDSLTIADLKVLVWTNSLRSGHLEYVPTDSVSRIAPELERHRERLMAYSPIANYYSNRR
ncbi:glutathione S-transferase [Pleionea sediminis]|uniref:glutathione S-transferase n=1 Tax=Pleionea sediminis TaxID=2569479 RepID=UPI0011852E6B|nr:glutathione S-transferase family protein [Pleionea sediminis]